VTKVLISIDGNKATSSQRRVVWKKFVNFAELLFALLQTVAVDTDHMQARRSFTDHTQLELLIIFVNIKGK
jgi:hypothetical protein